MTHTEALDVVAAWIFAVEPGDPTYPAQRAAAEEHVACCVECWQEVSDMGAALGTVTPEIAKRMRILFGCDEIAEQLYRVVAINAGEVARRFPRIAAHLSRCLSCREILADLEAASLAESLPPSLPWRDLVISSGERLRELVGDVVFGLRQGIVARACPDGLLILPIGGDVAALRGRRGSRSAGDEPTTPAEAPGQGFRLDLDTIDLGVDLLIESHGTDRVRLEVQVLRAERSVSLALRRVDGDLEQLVAAQDAAPARKFVAANLQPGAYHLEIRDSPTAVRHRVRLLLERE